MKNENGSPIWRIQSGKTIYNSVIDDFEEHDPGPHINVKYMTN